MDWLVVQILSVILLATLVRSAFGFGGSLVAVPLLALIIPVEVAAPVMMLISVTVAAAVLVQDWSEMHMGSAGRLLLATIPGIPLGLLLLTRVAEPVVKTILAGAIIAFPLYSLFVGRRFDLKNDRFAWLFGFGAGILGGAYGMNGPPLAIYGTLRGWSPRHFRATLQGYFLPSGILVVAGYWSAGLWTPTVTRYYLFSLPVVAAAIFAGRAINRRMDAHRFVIYIQAGLVAIGALLLGQVWL